MDGGREKAPSQKEKEEEEEGAVSLPLSLSLSLSFSLSLSLSLGKLAVWWREKDSPHRATGDRREKWWEKSSMKWLPQSGFNQTLT